MSAQQFPNISAPFVDVNRCITPPWQHLLQALWNRTGGAVGISSEDLALLALLGQAGATSGSSSGPGAQDAALLALTRAETPPDLTQALLLALALNQPATTPRASGYVLPASQAIAAGDLVNVYVNSGVMMVRKADGSDPTKFCNGFSLTGIGNGLTGPIQFAGFNDQVTVSTGASEVWLSDVTPGAITATAPTTTGHLLQTVGTAVLGLGLAFAQGTYTIL